MSDFNSTIPTLHYFNLRGRGDVIRMALCQSETEWREVGVDYTTMKQAGPNFPFGQAPVFTHNGLTIAQTDAILRYIGREWGMYGESNVEATMIDMMLLGVEAIRAEYLKLCYQSQFSEEARQEYISSRLEESSAAGTRNNGAHFKYLEDLLGEINMVMHVTLLQ